MIIGLVCLSLGIIGVVLDIILRKKITKAWFVSLLVTALLVATTGTVFTVDAANRNNEDKRSVYMALHYLENHYTTEATYYLKQVQTDSVCSLGAETLLEIMRGNEMLAQFKQDALKGKAKTDTERSLCLKLAAVNADDVSTQMAVIQSLRDALGLSKSQMRKVDKRFMMESGCYVEGVEQDESELDEEEAIRLRLNNYINNEDYGSAVSVAASLVDKRPNAKNRLLLAELIAEATYSGYYLNGYEFSADERIAESVQAQRKKLTAQLDSLELELNDTKTLLNSATGEETVRGLQDEIARLNAEILAVQEKFEHLFLERAFNSIADIVSLEAGVVRARMEFARNDYEGAMEQLEKTIRNPFIQLGVSGDVKNAISILEKTISSNQTTIAQTPEFRDAMDTLVSSVGNELVAIYSGDLSKNMAEYIVGDQKSFGKDLFVNDIDTSAYPQVTITLSGRDNIIEKIIAQKEVILRDTHTPVTYTVTVPDGTEAISDICCVVDESGSMDGAPMADLKNALSGFISRLKENANIGIVGFEGAYTIHCEVGDNHKKAAAAVNNLHAQGGTNITAGIQGAMEAMKKCTGQKTILLMTDGQSDIDMDVVAHASSMGYVIHCIGFGGVNDQLLQGIADATGGQYIRADSSSELINVYMSLVGIIGNQVKITYTVDQVTTTEEVRYFFVRDPETGTNIWVDYSPVIQQQPQLICLGRTLYTKDELNSLQEYGNLMEVELYGRYLTQVTEVNIGGMEAQIVEQSDAWLRVALEPKLAVGWQDVVLTDGNHNEIAFRSMLLVAEETLKNKNYQLDDIQISSGNAVLTDDDMLVLSGRICFRNEEKGLELYVEGLLYVEVESDFRQQLQERGTIKLHSAAELKGSGVAYLGRSDDGYLNYGNFYVAMGQFHFERDADWFRIVQD